MKNIITNKYFIVIIIVLIFASIFPKIQNIEASGNYWYTNFDRNQKGIEHVWGKGGPYSTEGFNTEQECNADLDEQQKYQAGVIFSKCFLSTSEKIAVIIETNKKKSDVIYLNTIKDAESLNKTKYTLLSKLPGIKGNCIDTNPETVAQNGCASGGVGDFVNLLVQLAIGICGALAVVMIFINGIKYMGDESVFGHTESIEGIKSAVFGLMIALGSYAILNTVDPALLGKNGISIDQVSADIKHIEYIPMAQYADLTGKQKLTSTEYESLAKSVSKGSNMKYCATRVILQRESRHNPGAIGFDSDVPSNNIKARKDFINSKIKYSSSTFSTDANSIKNKSLINDDKSYRKTPDLGLDWRFSHGIGLGQITCQPKSTNFNTRTSLPNCPGGKTPIQLLDPEINLTVSMDMWVANYNRCGSVAGAFSAYNSGDCNPDNSFTSKYVAESVALYNQCMK